MNLREGPRRLALFLGLVGAILGGFASLEIAILDCLGFITHLLPRIATKKSAPHRGAATSTWNKFTNGKKLGWPPNSNGYSSENITHSQNLKKAPIRPIIGAMYTLVYPNCFVVPTAPFI